MTLSNGLTIVASAIILTTIGCFIYIGIIINDIDGLRENIKEGMEEFRAR